MWGGSSPTPENKAPPAVSRVPQFPLGEGSILPLTAKCLSAESCAVMCPWELVVGTCGKSASGGVPGVVGLIGMVVARRGAPGSTGRSSVVDCSRLRCSGVEKLRGCHCGLGDLAPRSLSMVGAQPR